MEVYGKNEKVQIVPRREMKYRIREMHEGEKKMCMERYRGLRGEKYKAQERRRKTKRKKRKTVQIVLRAKMHEGVNEL